METIKCLKTRRCKRDLQPGNVDKKVIEEIIDCGHLAPTANNIQPCEFVVITDRQTLIKLSQIAVNGSFAKSASFCVVVIAKNEKYYVEDGSAATENILLAVNDFGLSACWVAGDKKDYADAVLKLLGVPQGYKLVSILPVGVSKSQAAVQKRDLKDVLHWEKF